MCKLKFLNIYNTAKKMNNHDKNPVEQNENI